MLRRLLIACWLGAAVTVCLAGPVTVTDKRGQVVQLQATPERIVTLLPSFTEFICALGACGKLVATDRHSDWPESVRALPRLGALGDTSVEAIVRLQPDVVLVEPSSRIAGRLESFGLKVLVLQAENTAQAFAQLDLLGRLLDKQADAQRLRQRIEQQISAAAGMIPSPVRGRRVYFEVAPAPYAAGESSFIGELLGRLGLRNIAPDDLGPFPRLNPEYIVQANPDIIMAQRAELARMPDRPGWARLNALQNGQVCAFEPSVYKWLVRPGPRMGLAAQKIADCLQALPGQPKVRL